MNDIDETLGRADLEPTYLECTICGHSHPDEVANAWGLPGYGPLCADCWSTTTEIVAAVHAGDWGHAFRLASRSSVCV